jgi:hypothetical protein
VLTSCPLFLLTKDAQKKKLSKRKRWYMGRRPKPHALLKKRGKTFAHGLCEHPHKSKLKILGSTKKRGTFE